MNQTVAPAAHRSLDEMPDDARLWSFAAARVLTPDETSALLDEVDTFPARWHAHGRPVTEAREWRLCHRHF